jgi:hypothetical protein
MFEHVGSYESMKLEKFSMGMGDRFGCEGVAQLSAIIRAKEAGASIAPVWNKSHREHTITHTAPDSVREEADVATAALGWGDPYYVDADHIGLGNVDLFMESSDFFTLDVADFIGQNVSDEVKTQWLSHFQGLTGTLRIPGIQDAFELSSEQLENMIAKYAFAVMEAAKLYRHIEAAKGKDNFVTEVSMDETDEPQTPVQLLFILAALSKEGVPAQTIAPRFSGRFNKGVDYVGEVGIFSREFDEDLCVIRYAVEKFGLPENLKLSVHSGSDKFSIYGPIHEALKKHDAGVHLKTAGTTWLEEIIGLALSGDDGLALARDIYAKALGRFDELSTPYASVIDIDVKKLPVLEVVAGWSGEEYANTLRHDPACADYNLHFRQLLHVGYKIAVEEGTRFTDALTKHKEVIAREVSTNIFERHIRPVFIGA